MFGMNLSPTIMLLRFSLILLFKNNQNLPNMQISYSVYFVFVLFYISLIFFVSFKSHKYIKRIRNILDYIFKSVKNGVI